MKNNLFLYKSLFNHFSYKRKRQLIFLIVLMIVSSLAEVISIGAIVPFLGIISNPDIVFHHDLSQSFIKMMHIDSPSDLWLPITIFFVFSILISGLIRLTLLYLLTRISYKIGAEISMKIYHNTLHQDYMVHISRNSSNVIDGVIGKTDTVIELVLSPLLLLINSLIFMFGIIAVLLFIDAVVAATIFLFFGVLYFVVIKFTRRQLEKNSKAIAKQSILKVQSLQEGLGGIRDVILDNSQEFYCKLYHNADTPLRDALGNNLFIANAPRYLMEAIGISFIAVLAYFIVQTTESVITVLGSIALGIQKLLPVLQQSYRSYSTIKGAYSSFYDVILLLDQKVHSRATRKLSSAPLMFEDCIELRNVSFRYSKSSPWVLKKINLKINKGDCVGFVGRTGSGKSTLVDLIMGLLVPTEGEIIIDNKIVINDLNRSLWQMNIAHVPQSIYLSDSSIAQNIAFGVNKDNIIHDRVKKSAEDADIAKTIKLLDKGYDSLVGERGTKLSGGERQRIGIARALYKNTNVLILDEATSALDNATEKKIMKNVTDLGSKSVTILIIAHRITTLKNCNLLIKVENNGRSEIIESDDIF